MDKFIVTPELVRELLSYDKETGKFCWKVRDSKYFSSVKFCNAWNSRFAGKNATSETVHGYLRIKIFGRPYAAHRIAWLYEFGVWPEADIDHINGAKKDNSIINLRDVSRTENIRNSAIRSTNTSGCPGVKFNKKLGKWEVSICHKSKHQYLGVFSELGQAIACRKDAEKKFGYHENHGRKGERIC